MGIHIVKVSAATLSLLLCTHTLVAQDTARGTTPVPAPALTPPPPLPPLPLNGPTIKIKQGQVQGALLNDVAIYRGLPFAAPPVGELRWRKPAAPLKWKGVRAANVFGSGCSQAEDCLYLNVYAPANATKKSKLPVMFYMHGGGFVGGSGSGLDGTQFAKAGVVLITTNYRLGRAGWFAHPAITKENYKGMLGNYGLMDQIAALHWIQDNAAAFGGDKNNVTIFGGSAGAISVNYLMLAPQARGLFHKAISESGFGRIAAQPLHTDDGAKSVEHTGMAFAESVGIKASEPDALKKLRALSWADMTRNVGGVGAVGQPLPMIDGKLVASNVYDGFAKGKQARIPYMVGGNSDEASLYRRNTDPAARFAAIKEPRTEFLALFDPDKTNDTPRIVARLITDQSISEPDRAVARLHAKQAPTFVYHFSYVPLAQRATAFGMGHGGETQYVFNAPRLASFDEEGKAIARAANNYWVAFAKTGDPGAAGGTKWPSFDSVDEALLEFPSGGVPRVQNRFHAERLNWVEAHLGQ